MNCTCDSLESVPIESQLTYILEFDRLELSDSNEYMKTTLKDTQISLRFNGEILEAMKAIAANENISLSDFITKMFQERDKLNNLEARLEARLEALERVVFQQSAA